MNKNLLLVDEQRFRRQAAHGDQLAQAEARYLTRLGNLPRITYADNLPVSERAEEIIALIKANQVIIVTGETGSGKTTQLPKIALAAGCGRRGSIGHTQPRRIAARSVAERIASELGEDIGQSVGYKVRFTDQSSDMPFVKLMTDGILLAEAQGDRFLNRYDTLIIDEAHERSLNIDFLLGMLKQLLPKRPELKLIITSATIDAERFAQFFAKEGKPAPLIAVSGRLYPVELRYLPVQSDDDDERAIEDAVADAIEQLWGPPQSNKLGDVLVFLPGEREIRETADVLRHRLNRYRGLDLLPLFARLSASEQQAVFRSGAGRRVVLATNVAETSITVPGIRFVVDTGLARVNRYAPRSKITLLQIEAVSQAAANQRAGRCGRVGPGVCVRLYSEDDFRKRPEYSDPEILRASLASVILRCESLRLGKVEHFPFIEAPSGRAVADGYAHLQELGALADTGKLTAVGEQMSRLPVSPKIARMLIAAKEQTCLAEVLVIASALSVPDPRERPFAARGQADQAHLRFNDERSDFVSLLNIWQFFQKLSDKDSDDYLSHSKQVAACRAVFLNWLRLREWRDVYLQLKNQLQDLGFQPSSHISEPIRYEAIHKALLTGLLGHLGLKNSDNEQYQGTRGVQFALFPGSGVQRKNLKLVCAAELVDTQRLFARTVAKIEAEWVESIAAHLLEREYFDPHWDAERGFVGAYERTSLYGLTLTARKRINYERVEPELARGIFIREALAEAEVHAKDEADLPFLQHNRRVIAEHNEWQHKLRRQDVTIDSPALEAFYLSKLPKDIGNMPALKKWKDLDSLRLSKADIEAMSALSATEALYPDVWTVGGLALKLQYRFEPRHPMDGLTLQVPLASLGSLRKEMFTWSVLGMRRELIASMLKTLPKQVRARLLPIQASAPIITEFLAQVNNEEKRALSTCLAEFLTQHLRPQFVVREDDFVQSELPPHTLPGFQVLDANGKELAYGRDLAQLQFQFKEAAQTAFQAQGKSKKNTAASQNDTPMKTWAIGQLPQSIPIKLPTGTVYSYPCLRDTGEAVVYQVLDTEADAAQTHRQGVLRLLRLELKAQLTQIEKGPSNFQQIALQLKSVQNPQSLLNDFLDSVFERAALAEDALPYDEKAFKNTVQRCKARLAAVYQAACTILTDIAARTHALNQALYSASGAHGPVIPALKKWRDELVYDGFLRQTPWSHWQHLPRYIEAVQHRMNKFRDYPHREVQHAPVLRQWKERLDEQYMQYAYEPAKQMHWKQMRWHIEELHVSLFAQELKTAYPISNKRLEKIWAEHAAVR